MMLVLVGPGRFFGSTLWDRRRDLRIISGSRIERDKGGGQMGAPVRPGIAR